MKSIISLLVFAGILFYVGNSMATSAKSAIGAHHVQLQEVIRNK